MRCSQVFAAAQGRHYVVPSDVQRLVPPVLSHRLVLQRDAALDGTTAAEVLADVLAGCRCRGPARPEDAGVRTAVRPTARGVGTFLLADAALALGLVAGYPGLVGLGVALLAVVLVSLGGVLVPGAGRGQPPARARAGAPAARAARSCSTSPTAAGSP